MFLVQRPVFSFFLFCGFWVQPSEVRKLNYSRNGAWRSVLSDAVVGQSIFTATILEVCVCVPQLRLTQFQFHVGECYCNVWQIRPPHGKGIARCNRTMFAAPCHTQTHCPSKTSHCTLVIDAKLFHFTFLIPSSGLLPPSMVGNFGNWVFLPEWIENIPLKAGRGENPFWCLLSLFNFMLLVSSIGRVEWKAGR